jgi:hypothetical protein
LEVHNLLKEYATPLIIRRNLIGRKIEFGNWNCEYETDIRVAGKLQENVPLLLVYEKNSQDIFIECVDLTPSSIEARWTKIVEVPNWNRSTRDFDLKLILIDRDNYVVKVILQQGGYIIYHVVISKGTVTECQLAEKFDLDNMRYGIFGDKLVMTGELKNLDLRRIGSRAHFTSLEDRVFGYFSEEAHIFKPVCFFDYSKWQDEDGFTSLHVDLEKIEFLTMPSPQSRGRTLKKNQIEIQQLFDFVNNDCEKKNFATGKLLTEFTSTCTFHSTARVSPT